MSIICIAKGTATIGLTTRGADGQIISQTPARWEHDPDGGCVALWTMNPETEEQEAPARIYGDWQASEYLGDILAELKPRRKVNLPDKVTPAREWVDNIVAFCEENEIPVFFKDNLRKYFPDLPASAFPWEV